MSLIVVARIFAIVLLGSKAMAENGIPGFQKLRFHEVMIRNDSNSRLQY